MAAVGPGVEGGSLELPADMDHWDDLFGFVQNEAQHHLQGNPKEYGLNLACEELISNIIRYNPPEAPDGSGMTIQIESRIVEEPRRLRFTISYNAAPFDPRFQDLSTSVDDTAIENRKIGGLGLFLIKNSVDHIRYEFLAGRNVYTVETDLA